MIKVKGDPIDTDTVGKLEVLRDTSQYLQVVAFAIAALRPRGGGRTFGYYKTAAPKRDLVAYLRGRRQSAQWAESAAHLAFRLNRNLRHEVTDNVGVALCECEKASKAS